MKIPDLILFREEAVWSYCEWLGSRLWHYPTVVTCVMRHVEAEHTHIQGRHFLLYGVRLQGLGLRST
jgi:hypothetical protein